MYQDLSLELPEWMCAWPRGQRPARVSAAANGLSLHYVHPEAGWAEIRAYLTADDVVAVRVGRSTIENGAALSRLAELVRRRLLAHGEGSRVLLRRARAVATAFTGRGGVDDAALGALASWVSNPDGGLSEQELSRWATLAPGAKQALGVLLAGRGEAPRALRLAASESSTSGCKEARALLLALQGLAAEAIAVALEAKEDLRGTGDFSRFGAVGDLLGSLDQHAEATACFGEALRWSDDVADALRLAHAAEKSRDVAAAGVAAARLSTLDASEEQLNLAVDSIFSAGATRAASQLLERMCEQRPSAWRWARRAELELYRLNIDEAVELAEQAHALDADCERASLVRGACHVVQSEPSDAVGWLNRVSRRDVELLATACLWSARLHFEAGELELAAQAMKRGKYADRMAWKVWRSLVEGLLAPEQTFYGKLAYQARAVLHQFFGFERAAEAYAGDVEGLKALHLEAIALMGGNYSQTPTLLVRGQLQRTDICAPRIKATDAQRKLTTQPLEQVLREFETQLEEMPYSPFPETYSTELLLWSGSYQEARDRFQRVWEQTRTRWGYIGLGAAEHFLGQHEQALATWESGLEHYGEHLPTEATHAYRGEAKLELGRLQEALADLQFAVESCPTRVGARMTLAEALAQNHEVTAARAQLDELGRRALALLLVAAERAGVSPDTAQRDELIALARAGRQALLGNRATSLYTFRDSQGRWRVLGSVPPSHWHATAAILSRPALTWLVSRWLERL